MPNIEHLKQITHTPLGMSQTVFKTHIISPSGPDAEKHYENLKKWVDKKLCFIVGSRNQYITLLAGAANRIAIDKSWLLDRLTKDFSDPTFPTSEIAGIVLSLYRNTGQHGVSTFEKSVLIATKPSGPVPQETPEVDLLSKYESIRISSSKHIPTPDPIVSINEGVISTSGNLTVISGNSKSGKTSFCNVIIAGGIQVEESIYDGFEGVNIAVNKDGKAVIHIDTEQAMHSHFKNYKSILRRAGLETDPEFFISLNIREVDMGKRRELVRDIFKDCAAKFKGVHLAIIDGAADLINSVNDEDESNKLVHFLEKLAIEYDCPIIIIIHFNPGGEKQRGHLGSQLQRKAESVLAIKKNGDISFLEPQFLRNAGTGDIPPVSFSYDKEKGYHVFSGIMATQNKEQEKIEKLKALANIAFADHVSLSHKKLLANIMQIESIKETAAKERVARMFEIGQIEKDLNNNYILPEDPEPPF